MPAKSVDEKGSNVISSPMDPIGQRVSFQPQPPVRVRMGSALTAGVGSLINSKE